MVEDKQLSNDRLLHPLYALVKIPRSSGASPTEAQPDAASLTAEEIKQELLLHLGRTLAQIDELQVQADVAANGAREVGATWREIGRVAGVTPQAAQTRWSEEGRQRNRENQRKRRQATED